MIKMIRRYFFLLLFCFCCKRSLTQSTTHKIIDSLYTVLKTQQKPDTNRVKTLNVLPWHLRILGESIKGKEIAEKALKLSDELDYKPGKANALNLLGIFDWEAGNYQKAIENYKICVTINEEIGNNFGLGDNLINIGNIYWTQGNYTDAAKYYKSALTPYKEAGYIQGMVYANNNLGETYAKQGNYPGALKYYFEALKISKNIDDKTVIANCYGNIGGIYMSLMNYPEALKNYQTSLTISQEFGNKAGVGGSYRSIGELYEKQTNYAAALSNYKTALKVFIELGIKDLTASVYNNIGSVHLHQDHYSEALNNFNAAATILENIGSKEPLTVSYIGIGETLAKQAALEKDKAASNKKSTDAIRVLNKGLFIAKDIGVKERIREGYKVLSDIYKGVNDYKKALDFNTLYVEMKDSLLNNETTQKLEQLRTQYEVEKAIAGEKEQQEKAQAERKRKNDLLLTGLGILAIVSVFSFLLIRQRNLKKRAIEKADSAHKMAELELQSLRAQLNPHFMFNSLNAIQDLILKEDNHRSHLYLSRFSKLLRMLLDNANQPFVSVKQELDFLELYLSLENLRIPDLQFSIEKDAKLNAEERMIPNMMLQPYIENAIWHGLSHKKENRKLEIRVHENQNATEFEIEDNGVGRKKAEEMKSLYRKGHTSKGMELLSKRFGLLSKEYGASIHTSITDLGTETAVAGTLVKIIVPFSLSEQAKKMNA